MVSANSKKIFARRLIAVACHIGIALGAASLAHAQAGLLTTTQTPAQALVQKTQTATQTPAQATTQTPTQTLTRATVIVVRHGEKMEVGGAEEKGNALPDREDPPLSVVGIARAARLAKMLAVAKVNAIYVTQYQRTALLAAPLAAQLSITPTVVPAADLPSLLARIALLGPDDVALVVGHSNTVGLVLKGLGAREAVTLTEADYDNIFILVPSADGRPRVTRLKY